MAYLLALDCITTTFHNAYHKTQVPKSLIPSRYVQWMHLIYCTAINLFPAKYYIDLMSCFEVKGCVVILFK